MAIQVEGPEAYANVIQWVIEILEERWAQLGTDKCSEKWTQWCWQPKTGMKSAPRLWWTPAPGGRDAMAYPGFAGGQGTANLSHG